MIKVSKSHGYNRIHVVEDDRRPFLLATVFQGQQGPVYGHAENIAFFEVKNGVMRSSHYTIGQGTAHSRRFTATPAELRKAFTDAGIPAPRIVERAEMLKAANENGAKKAVSPILAA